LRFKKQLPTGGINDRRQLIDGEDSVSLTWRERRRPSGPRHQHTRVDVKSKTWDAVSYDASQDARLVRNGMDRRPSTRSLVNQPYVAVARKDSVPILYLEQQDAIVHDDQRVDVHGPFAGRQILK
jgi:hypothetical protein